MLGCLLSRDEYRESRFNGEGGSGEEVQREKKIWKVLFLKPI